MSQRFAQLSDPHLTTLEGVPARALLSKRLLSYLSWRRRRRYEHRREVLDALQEDLNGQELDQLLISGDLTHVGLPDEFRQARLWLESLGKPEDIAVIPGNHDALVATPWQDTLALWEGYLASDADSPNTWPSVRVRGDIVFIGLSSACPTPPLMASGAVDAGQLQRLAAVLSRYRGHFRVVQVHHSPVPGAEKWRKRLRNAGELAGVVREHGAELVLHGHGHRARRDSLATDAGDVPVISVPSASAMGLHGGEVAAYNCYTVSRRDQGWSLEVESRCYDPAACRFIEGQSRRYSLPRW